MTDKEETRKRIGRRIAEIRAARGLSQSRLATLTGLRQPHISRIEQGSYSAGLDTLELIAEAVGCVVDFVEVPESPAMPVSSLAAM